MNIPPHPCTTKWRPHLFLAATIGLWLAAFLVITAPFDASDLSFKGRLILLPPYSLLFLLAYLSTVALQNMIYRCPSPTTAPT